MNTSPASDPKFRHAARAAAIILATAIAPPCAAAEETSAPARAPRIGYVDIGRVTDRARSLNPAAEEIATKVRGINNQIKAKLERGRALDAEIEKGRGVDAATVIDAKRREVGRIRDELDAMQAELQRERKRLDETVLEPLLKQLDYAIEDTAKELQYDLVLRGETVLFGRKTLDISDEVSRRVEKALGGKGGAALAPGAAAAPEPATAATPPPGAEGGRTVTLDPPETRTSGEGAGGAAARPAATKRPARPRPTAQP